MDPDDKDNIEYVINTLEGVKRHPLNTIDDYHIVNNKLTIAQDMLKEVLKRNDASLR